MTHADNFFAQSYAEARAKFLAASAAAGLAVTGHVHPLPGHDGEVLAMDIVRDGPADAKSLLLVTSACHGVEGFCGSGVQGALLADSALRQQARDAGIAILFIHALNPWGFSQWRRTTHENVDLNRNFQDFSQPLPRNTAYDEVAHLIVPEDWPPTPAVVAQIEAWVAKNGLRAWQTATSGGQYHHPDGVFFGGQAPTWSQNTLRGVLREHGRQCRRLGWIDLHTGLGPNGHGELIFACRDDAAALGRARAWWGDGVTSIYDGSSSSALLTGLMWLASEMECPQAEYTGIAVEYGTLPFAEVSDALRADQWMANNPDKVSAELRTAIRRQVRDAFYTDTPEWKAQIVAQGLDATRKAITGLSLA